jgi:hypothetical protein
MPQGVMNVPVVSVAPTAEFVGMGARKPLATIEWTAEVLAPQEIAALVAIPDAFLLDAGFPVWESVRAEVSSAIAYALDAAVLYGTNAPASYPAGGIAALAGAPQTGADAHAAIDAAATVIETSGLIPDGIAAGAAIGSALRAAYREVGALPSAVPQPTIYGMPVVRTAAWDDTKGDALVGAWDSALVVGIREDLTFDISQDATLTDGAGKVVLSAFESDMSVLRVYVRVAVAIARRVAPGGGLVVPFSFAKWTGGTTARSKA